MANLLFLVHRMPYPPDKGDKVRSYHLLKHLGEAHRVFVGTFVDDPADLVHLEALRGLCADLLALPLNPRRARIASLAGLLDGRSLTLHYYRARAMRAWVRRIVATQDIAAIVVFSSSMAQYALGLGLPVLIDFVDVDSAKWTEYAARHPWPLSTLYRLEGRRLLAYERHAAANAERSFFVTDKEAALFERLAPECAARVDAVGNGVDAAYFAPDPARPSPFAAGELPLVFTGAMDYWPNIDAVAWFVADILPALRARWPAARLHIVGRSPSAEVRALAGEAVSVSGTVPDVRPYLQHAAVTVAPLRLARGIQNKILEAMAMARPVVATRACAEAVAAKPGAELISVADAAGFVEAVDALLREPARAAALGGAGRERVLAS
ncbi:MAG: TIGR03087 family PEP-CTERM/XrtA system glycosyltransferase, partial [Burkholderiales bacterium]|nr:TIGR03087 family PEP-CTERM/XrtA system glycosyltransferase [Burkholderiales bacterium]